jgi:diguanylate cyclase (GGDEF)-like protein
MSLQRRLTLFFVLIVMLPLAAAGFVVRHVVVGEVERRVELSLLPPLHQVETLYESQTQSLRQLARLMFETRAFATRLDSRNPSAMQAFLERKARAADTFDFLWALDRHDEPLGAFVRPPDFDSGFERPSAQSILTAIDSGEPTPGLVAERFSISSGGRGKGSLIAGFWIDREFLARASHDGVELAALSGDRTIAATAPLAAETIPDEPDTAFRIPGGGIAQTLVLADSTTVLAAVPQADAGNISGKVLGSMAALLLAALAITTLLAYWLARLITEPLHELASGAEAISQGDFGHQIQVRSRDEVGHLARAFNEMSRQLEIQIGELSSSSALLQRAIHRVGETLRSTHDMRSILQSVLNTAADAVQADCGLLWTFTPTRSELYPAIGRDLDISDFGQVGVGSGIVGHVAERGTTLVRPAEGSRLSRSRGEPDYPVALVIPLTSQSRIIGVVALYREQGRPVFSDDDKSTALFLVEQGGFAAENVSLHEEAQRLSIMDGLTGVWNRRYFQMQFRGVLATAVRFERPFSVLMLDLDHFKSVNDTYGHQCGDSVLIEFAQRVNESLREVDTFARYGGEEFICLLSETDVEGAVTTARKIHHGIRSRPFRGFGDEPIDVTVSIGIASYPVHGASYDALVSMADQALYKAKSGGRDRIALPGGEAPPNLKVAT